MDIRIIVNKKETAVPEGATVSELLELLGYNSNRSSVWIDGGQLLRREYPSTVVAEGQNLTIRRIVAGG